MTPHPDQFVRLYNEPTYGFDDKGPAYHIRQDHVKDAWVQTIHVDPAPCYHHNLALVEQMLVLLQGICPLPIPLQIAVLAHEDPGRWNGTYYNNSAYHSDAKSSTPHGLIVLTGKRIPLMPAMTRYLVAHEYGHAVQYAIERMYGLKSDQMEPGYITHFRHDAKNRYGCGHWHTNIGELIANDFRILLAHTEEEFWPHDGYARPEDVEGLYQFWSDIQTDFRAGVTEKPTEELYRGYLPVARHECAS